MKQPAPKPSKSADDEFDEERIPFDEVVRHLLHAKPQHKTVAASPKPTAKPRKKAKA